MKKMNMLIAAAISVTTATAFALTVDDQQEQSAKSVAWYTANVREARAKNKICFDNKALQSTTDCKNALHALEIIYVGVGN